MNIYNKKDIPQHLQKYFEPIELGLEKTPEEYVEKLVVIFREVKRVLRPDGTLFLNLGDSYLNRAYPHYTNMPPISQVLKPKDLCGIPWRVALALQADGWWLRQDIIWNKPNPMPESVTDRCTKSHEYIFLLAKSARYYYDHEAIKEDSVDEESYSGRRFRGAKAIIQANARPFHRPNTLEYGKKGDGKTYEKRNKRSVWTVTVDTGNGIHFAIFPEDLIVDCIKAGCPKDGVVLDCFAGSCTTGRVAAKLGRNYICIELNPKYIDEIGQYNIDEAETGVSIREQLQGQKPLFEKIQRKDIRIPLK